MKPSHKQQYETGRAILEKQYYDDAQGFYYADFRSSMKHGQEITMDHVEAVMTEIRYLMGNDDWRDLKF